MSAKSLKCLKLFHLLISMASNFNQEFVTNSFEQILNYLTNFFEILLRLESCPGFSSDLNRELLLNLIFFVKIIENN